MGSMDSKKRTGDGKRNWKANRHSLHWSDGPTDTIKSFIGQLTDAGCGVLFSRTQDGSALIISVYAGNETSKEFLTEPGDIVPCFDWLLSTYVANSE